MAMKYGVEVISTQMFVCQDYPEDSQTSSDLTLVATFSIASSQLDKLVADEEGTALADKD